MNNLSQRLRGNQQVIREEDQEDEPQDGIEGDI